MQKLLLTNAVEESTYDIHRYCIDTHRKCCCHKRLQCTSFLGCLLLSLSSPEQEFISGVSNAAPLPSANAGVSNHPFPSLYHLQSKPSHVSASAYNMHQSLRFLTAYIDTTTKTEHTAIYIGI